MGKRSNFKRVERDFYPTPKEAVLPLLPFLQDKLKTFAEPCCGEGDLIFHLGDFGYICNWASDIEDRMTDGNYIAIDHLDALKLKEEHLNTYGPCDYIITNPPWDRKIPPYDRGIQKSQANLVIVRC